MNIVATIPVWNCDETLEDCLNSLNGKVDGIILFEGKWKLREYGSLRSTDRTINIIEDFSKRTDSFVILVQNLKPVLESECRSFMYSMVRKGDWILSVDSDEIILEWNVDRDFLSKTDEKAFRVHYITKSNLISYVPKFFKRTEGLTCTADPMRLLDFEGEIGYRFAPPIDITLRHHFLCKTKKSKIGWGEYIIHLQEYIQKFGDQIINPAQISDIVEVKVLNGNYDANVSSLMTTVI
jgi:glycosyltransferase involved in cell wall biosynthesis